MKQSLLLPLLLLASGLFAQHHALPAAAKMQPPPMDPSQLQGPPQDVIPPQIACLNGLSANLLQTGALTLWAFDFLQFVNDNETPAGQIKLGIRLSGTGTGFPVDASGSPVLTLQFDCSQLGVYPVELWAMDEAGNTAFCETNLQVNDSFGYCDPNNSDSVVVCIKSGCDGTPMEGLMVNLYGTSIFQPPFLGMPSDSVTDENGCITIHFPIASNYVIAPEKDDEPLNGVTTYDLLLISRHILGIEPLGNPFKMIAADANKSGSITTFDLVELRKLILGIYSELPNNTSWRFIDGDFMFLNPMNPFATAFPESFGGLQGGFPDTVKFVGVKTGDVDCSAMLNGVPPPDYPDVFLSLPDTFLVAGQVYDIPIFMPGNTLWAGYQFELNFDSQKLAFQGAQYHPSTNAGNWNIALNPGKLTTSWVEFGDPVAFGPNNPIAVLKFQALSDGFLKDEIALSNQHIRSEGYMGLNAEKRDLLLQFVPQFKKGPVDPVAEKDQPVQNPGWLNDFEPPTVVCLNGLSANIMPTGMVNLWATDFLQYVHDNATPDNQIQLGIRKAGTGSGFPATALGNPINSLIFSCNELGDSIFVELWAKDLAGNTAFCTTELFIQDNLGNCGGGGLNIKVCAQAMCSMAMMEEVSFFVNGTSNFAPPFAFFDLSNASGCFELLNNVPIASTFTVSAEKDDNPLNGVTSYDLELISKHIHGTEPFTEPWQWVAADANRDGLVTLEDSIELSKLMLGIYSELPNNTSWRFVPSGYQFSSPNPLSQPIPDTISVADILTSMDTLFMGIKIGDLNCTAVPNFSGSPTERDWAAGTKEVQIDVPRPNPTVAGSLIPVFLPFAEKIQLEIRDLSGRVITREERMLGKGDHILEIPPLSSPGVYVWSIRAGAVAKSGKLVRI